MISPLSPYVSRKFILAICGSIFALIAYKMGLSTDQVLTVVSPLLAYLGVQGTIDAMDKSKDKPPVVNPPMNGSVVNTFVVPTVTPVPTNPS